MSGPPAGAEDLVRSLPLPLAQLYRRALNARAPLERHQSAYFLWEAAVKLLSSTAIVTYAEEDSPDPQLVECLAKLARPSLGHWWEFAYRLVPALAAQDRPEFAAVNKLLFSHTAQSGDQAAALDAALRQELDARGPNRLRDLFDRLVQYRNREIGHGAVGRRPLSHYERMADLLLAGLTEILARLDVLAGSRLVYVAKVWRHRSGDWLITRDDLTGEAVRRVATLNQPTTELTELPPSDCLCLEAPASAAPLRALRPLVVYDADSGQVLFFNSQHGPRLTEYLNYTNGQVVNREEVSGERRLLLIRALGLAEEKPPPEEPPTKKTKEPPHEVARPAPPTPPILPPAPAVVAAVAAPVCEGPRVSLTVTAGPQQGRVFPFTGHTAFLVGRSRRADMQLPAADDTVSRLHFLVEINPPHCRVTDLATKNGTLVNGQRLAAGDLKDGDVIAAGQTSLRVGVSNRPPASPEGPTPPALEAILAARPAPRLPATVSGCPICGSAVPAVEVPLPLPFLCPSCRALAAQQPQPLAEYALLRELRRGQLGVAFLAVRRVDGYPALVRLLRPNAAPTPALMQCMLQQLSPLSLLDCPQIIALREFGESAGNLFFIHDHVPGADLTELLRVQGGALPVGRAMHLLCQILQALAFAHARELVHGGLRPDNVFVIEGDIVRLADFGLARVYQASPLSGLAFVGELGTTALFLAPEQLTRFQDVQPAADQYAAGALLYYLLTGQCPYELPQGLPRQLLRLLQDKPVPIEARRTDLPPELVAVIQRALAREPDGRFPDAAALCQAISPFAK
jgi:serine/threonine-protein kinase